MQQFFALKNSVYRHSPLLGAVQENQYKLLEVGERQVGLRGLAGPWDVGCLFCGGAAQGAKNSPVKVGRGMGIAQPCCWGAQLGFPRAPGLTWEYVQAFQRSG